VNRNIQNLRIESLSAYRISHHVRSLFSFLFDISPFLQLTAFLLDPCLPFLLHYLKCRKIKIKLKLSRRTRLGFPPPPSLYPQAALAEMEHSANILGSASHELSPVLGASCSMPSRRYFITIPAIQSLCCCGRRRRDETVCGTKFLEEAQVCANLEFGLISIYPWEAEYLRLVFEEIADLVLCHKRKAQIE
jgi:hypothetical protein